MVMTGDNRGSVKAIRRTLIRDCLIVGLTAVTGATDAISFTHLGGVFTSVMTGNMVLLGIAFGNGATSAMVHIGIAFGAYILGALIGARLVGAAAPGVLWPPRLTRALLVELGVFVAFATLWWSAGDAPSGAARSTLLALSAVALGLQSSAILCFGISGLSTTYLTGTLTTVVNALARRHYPPGTARAALTLLALVAGAALGGVLAEHVRVVAPLMPLGVLTVSVVVGARVLAG